MLPIWILWNVTKVFRALLKLIKSQFSTSNEVLTYERLGLSTYIRWSRHSNDQPSLARCCVLATAQYYPKWDTAAHYISHYPDVVSLSKSHSSPPRVPDVGFNAHAWILETGVHGEVNWIVRFPAVILVDQDRVFRDVVTCCIPSKEHMLRCHSSNTQVPDVWYCWYLTGLYPKPLISKHWAAETH